MSSPVCERMEEASLFWPPFLPARCTHRRKLLWQGRDMETKK